jgi:hypothetical protein
MFDGHEEQMARFVGHQISVVDQMASQLMTLAGVLLAITTSLLPQLSKLESLARVFLTAGSAIVLSSALLAGIMVFRLRWFTSARKGNSGLTEDALKIRNDKTVGYHAALALMLSGLVCYLAAVGVILI